MAVPFDESRDRELAVEPNDFGNVADVAADLCV